MARPRKKLKILLIEPNYSNKYPPIGLMKLSTYHKMLGHEVVFYKGDLKQFVIERIANKCIDEFYKIDENINWNLYKDLFVEYIRTRRRDFLVQIPISSTNMEILLTNKINQFLKIIIGKKKLGSRSRMGSRLCNNFVHVPLAHYYRHHQFCKKN